MNEKDFNSIKIHGISNAKSVAHTLLPWRWKQRVFSKPSVNSYPTTRRHFPEDSILHSLSSNNLYWTQNA